MSIERIGVVGAGVMGSEIAFAAAQAGIEVALRDVDRPLIDRGIAHVRSIADRRVSRGRMTAEAAEALVARVAPAEVEADLAGCGLVIEAVTEVMDVKLAVFAALDAATPPATILASNTSGLSISEIARATSRPDRVLGLHFFNPASTMKLVEVIRGDATSNATALAGSDLVRQLGKTPVAVAECPGFLVNRVLVRALCEAYR
jgi:3-hydroxybutyryl-CoA dehydrogenase